MHSEIVGKKMLLRYSPGKLRKTSISIGRIRDSPAKVRKRYQSEDTNLIRDKVSVADVAI
jgi:hypothetical protein